MLLVFHASEIHMKYILLGHQPCKGEVLALLIKIYKEREA